MARLLLFLLLPGCLTEAAISTRIAASDDCQTVDDCVNLGNICPFGCNLLVNADRADALREDIARYLESAESCSLECEPVAAMACEAFHCVTVFGE